MTKSLYQFRQFTNKDKLSQNTVNTILQDREGFMWFGTQDGLNRFDGSDFKIYKKTAGNTDSLSENFISCIFEDRGSNLWIGTHNSGLILYDKMNDSFIKNKSLSVLSNEYITSIAEDNDNNIWISTYHKGIFRFDKTNELLYEISLKKYLNTDVEKDKYPMSLVFNKNLNSIYAGIWGAGLFIIDLNGKLQRHVSENSKDNNTILSNKVICLFQDSKDDLWIGTQNGLNRYNVIEDTFEDFVSSESTKNCITGNNIKSICEDHSGNLWIGTYGEGLSKYDINKNKFENFRVENAKDIGFNCDTIFSLYIDKSEVLWIGTLAEGLLQYNTILKKFHSIVNYNEDSKLDERNKIRSIHVNENQNVFWGTFSDGLYICKKNNDKYTINKHSEINEKSVNCFLKNGNNDLLVGNEKYGLSILDMNNNSIFNLKDVLNKPNDLIFSLFFDKSIQHHLFVGTESEGLKLFDLNKNEIILENIIDDTKNCMVKSMTIDSNYSLWIATHLNGLLYLNNFKYDSKNTIEPEINYLDCGNTVWTVYEDLDKILWVGSASNGLNKININCVSISTYTEKDGLCNNCVLGILEDDNNNLWLSTTKGLSKFNKEDESFKNYDTSDGLNNLEFNEGAYFKHSDGTMYFGGNNGITYFHPSDIKDNPYIPNIVITEFEIFNKLVEGSPDNPFLKKNITYADEINLTYKESVFSFKFAALIFNNPQKNQYAYKMEGFDKDWTYSGTRRRVTYTNLDPGSYTFRVKGSNNDGIWNEEGTSIRINISPPYWKTWWFKSLGALSLIAATGISYRKRLEQMEKESRAQEDFSRKLIEVQENQMKRIAKELHDTIAHEVLISKQKAMMALKHKDDKDRMERTLEEISDLSSATITEVRSIAYKLRPHQLDKLGFTKSIKSIVNEVSRSTNINFVLDTDNVDEVLSQESEINLYRVVQETISNIIKHSGATEVILRVSRTEGYVEILIVDNGKGFDINSKAFDEARQGFGLSGIEERIKFMNGEINIDSELDKGTTLKFKIPIVNSDE